jgi:GTP cyclohydrolase I
MYKTKHTEGVTMQDLNKARSIVKEKLQNYNRAEMPDPGKNLGPVVEGIEITKVGIREYTSPIDVVRKDGQTFRAKGTFSVYASLAPHLKGVHMSRMTSSVQEATLNKPVDNLSLQEIADNLLHKLDSENVYLKVRFDYPLKQLSLDSMNEETGEPNFGWMYYPSTIEIRKNKHGKIQGYYTIDYLYSSTCPCSTLLSRDFQRQTGHPAYPHAQRSILTTTVEFDMNSDFHLEDLIYHHRNTIVTEVLGSTVKRSDELGFALLAAAQPLFCEDAARYMHNSLMADTRVLDHSLCAEHLESLHPSTATAIISRGIPNGLR